MNSMYNNLGWKIQLGHIHVCVLFCVKISWNHETQVFVSVHKMPNLFYSWNTI